MAIVLLFEDKGLTEQSSSQSQPHLQNCTLLFFNAMDMIYKEYLMSIWYDVIVILFHANRNSMNKMVYTPNFQILTLQTTK